jgi:hypothetical protein
MGAESIVYDEPADTIIDLAAKEGITLSDRQLAEWHRAGLIPKPKQQRLGRGKGSRSVYPNGTLRQAIACSTLMHQFVSKDWVGWELWVRGYPVREEHWRNPVGMAHKTFELFFASVTECSDAGDEEPPEVSDAGDELIANVADRLYAPERMGRARRRLGRERFNEFLGIAISAMIGSLKITEGVEDESTGPVQVLARLIGVDPGKHKPLIPDSPVLKVTGEAVAENLEAMAQYLPRIVTSISSDTIDESELVSARCAGPLADYSLRDLRRSEFYIPFNSRTRATGAG